MNPVAQIPFDGTLETQLNLPIGGGIELYWLGQAGFVVRSPDATLLIDPYLSNSLAEKYQGTRFPHQRMMAAPITVNALPRIDCILISHHHTDHMDQGTLAPLLALQPDARIVVPLASLALAATKIGCRAERLIGIDAGTRFQLSADVEVIATPSAHENRERDIQGHHRYLGYAIRSGGTTLWHSGDTVDFEGLATIVRSIAPSVTLLPVNGRSEMLTKNGIAGNLTLDEAAQLSKAVGARAMIAHHYGMFDFNTLDPAAIDAYASKASMPTIVKSQLGIRYEISA